LCLRSYVHDINIHSSKIERGLVNVGRQQTTLGSVVFVSSASPYSCVGVGSNTAATIKGLSKDCLYNQYLVSLSSCLFHDAVRDS
jgi:hypothetical protein